MCSWRSGRAAASGERRTTSDPAGTAETQSPKIAAHRPASSSCGKGSFRTRGRNAAATVRGTRWGTQDRCDGTLVIVQRGRVSVRDLVRHRTVLVSAGHAYLARRRG